MSAKKCWPYQGKAGLSFSLSLSVCVYVCLPGFAYVCVCVWGTNVKYVWTTLLCKMPNILQLVDLQACLYRTHSLPPPPPTAVYIFLALCHSLTYYMCLPVCVCVYVQIARRANLIWIIMMAPAASHMQTRSHTHTHTRLQTWAREVKHTAESTWRCSILNILY